jgi:multiple sugar transport system substrate-binding protein
MARLDGRAVRRAALAALLLLATGCAARPPGGATTTLRFWAMGREGEVVQELVRDFERENPGVRVQVQQIPWSAAHEKLLTSFVGGSTPDVSQLGNTWIAEFAALEALEPLDARLGPGGIDSSAYFPGIWDTNVIDGVTYGIPWYVDTRLLFYRRDLLRRAGYETMPQSWTEWRAALAAIKRVVGNDAYPVFLPFNEFQPLVALGLQAGSPLLADDGTRGAFAAPEFRRAFDFYLGLYRDGLAPAIGNNQIANMYQEFDRGFITMLITGPWNLGEFRNRISAEHQDDWATSALPGPDGPASGVSLAGGSSLVVFRRSEHRDAAWRLVEFLSRPEQQVRFWALTGDLPARREAWQDSALAADPNVRAFETQLQRVVSTPKVPEWELIASRLQDYSERVVRGALSADSALAALDREVDRLLEKRRWLKTRAAR